MSKDTMLNQNLTTTTTTSEDPVKLLHQAFEAQLHSNCLRQDVDILNRVRIRYYETEYIVLEKEFIEIAQNIKCANTTTMNYNYLDEPSVEMGNLLLITCSFIESIAADMDLTLDSIYSPVTYISTGNSEHDELLEKYLYSLEIHNFYEINHILLFPHKNQHNQQNHPTTKQPNTQPKRKPSDNIIKPQNCQDSKNVSTTTTTTKTKQEYRHFDYDCLAHLHHRLGVTNKRLYLKLKYLPEAIQHDEKLQFPLRNSHKYISKFLEQQYSDLSAHTCLTERPQWCKAYQGTKHYRLENLALGTGKASLQALGALYLLCLYAKNLVDAILKAGLRNKEATASSETTAITVSSETTVSSSFSETTAITVSSETIVSSSFSETTATTVSSETIVSSSFSETTATTMSSKTTASSATSATPATNNIKHQLQKMTIRSNLFAPYIAYPKIKDIPENIDSLNNSSFSNQEELRQAVFILQDPLKKELNLIDDDFAVFENTEHNDALVDILKLINEPSLLDSEILTPKLILNTKYHYKYTARCNLIKNIPSNKKTKHSGNKGNKGNKDQKFNFNVLSRTQEISDDIYDYKELKEKLKESGLWQ